MSNEKYIPSIPRFSTSGIAEQHQHWARSLTEPFSRQQNATLKWLLETKPMEQRPYVIIEDKRVLCGTKRKLYTKTAAGWRIQSLKTVK
jgi:hypothetical protein